jgi:hypothetical protein
MLALPRTSGAARAAARPRRGLLRATLAAAIATAAALAQDRPPSERAVVVQNLAPPPRDEWAAAVVPFARGEVTGSPDLHCDQCQTVWQPFGARWPDNSIRQALCLFRRPLDALGEARLALRAGAGPAVPWPRPELPPLELRFRFAGDGREDAAAPAFVAVREENAARKVGLYRCRVGGSGLVAEVIVTAWAGQEHADVELAVYFSDPGTEDMQRSVDELAVDSNGLALMLRHARRFATPVQPTPDGRGTSTVLLRGTALGDGQGIRRAGVLVPRLDGAGSLRDQTLSAAILCPPLAATSWRGTVAFGPFGYVPEPPPWLQSDTGIRTAFGRRHRDFAAASQRGVGDPFGHGPFGAARDPGQTGDQEDFGVVKLEPVAGTGLPSFLLEVEPSVLQEACRPVHNFEADGSPVLAAKHPDWVVWSGRTHWHCEVSKDRLGKPCPEPRFQSHGWRGKDRQHWSTNYTAAFALLTGSHGIRRELENEVQLFLAGETLDPRHTTSHSGAPRGAGRTLLAGCWLYLCTGDAELLQRMRDRVERVHRPAWAFAEADPASVRPLAVNQPDARMLDGNTAYWNPWQEAIAAVGFAALDRMAGDETARALAKGLALNQLRHGWKVTDREVIIATAMRWNEGVPLPEEEVAAGDKRTVVWSHGTAFSLWSLGAVELARQFAAQDGDAAMVARAEEILRRIRSARQVARDGWFDRFGQWDAVR